MAKRIKAIKCPQCGSTKQEKIDAEHFRCKSCGSEYILDSDDININHHYNYGPSQTTTEISTRKLAAIIGFIVLVISLLLGMGICNDSSTTTTSSFLESNRYRFYNQTNGFLFNDAGKPKLLHFGLLNGGHSNQDDAILNQVHFGVYDFKSKKYENLIAINGLLNDKKKENVSVQFQQFDDGMIYIIYRNTKVFVYNPKLQKLTDITPDIQVQITTMNTGIGQVNFNFKYYALDLISNTGKKATYFPSSKLILSEGYDSSFLSSIRSNDSLKVGYTTSDSRPGFLIQYRQYYKTGYPVYKHPEFKVELNEKDHASKVVFDTYEDRSALIQSTKMFHPEAVKFNLNLIGHNDRYVAYLYKLSVNEGERFHIQMMDHEGNILWNTDTGLENVALNGRLLTENGTIVLFVGVHYYLFKDGKQIDKVNHDEMNFDL